MNRIIVMLFLVVLALMPVTATKAQSEEMIPKTFILLRHAEKIQTINADPSLTLQGVAQANALADLLQDQHIAAIYSTPYRRTLETVAPLASQKKLNTQLYEPLYAISLLEQLKLRADSGAVVIVGHSNTIPEMVNALMGREVVTPISEEEYGMVFIVTAPTVAGSAASLVRLRLDNGKAEPMGEKLK